MLSTTLILPISICVEMPHSMHLWHKPKNVISKTDQILKSSMLPLCWFINCGFENTWEAVLWPLKCRLPYVSLLSNMSLTWRINCRAIWDAIAFQFNVSHCLSYISLHVSYDQRQKKSILLESTFFSWNFWHFRSLGRVMSITTASAFLYLTWIPLAGNDGN